MGIGESPLRDTRFRYFPKKKTYLSVQIDQISLSQFCKKHVLAPQDDFNMQKNLVNKHKQVGLGQTPPPLFGKYSHLIPFFFWRRP